MMPDDKFRPLAAHYLEALTSILAEAEIDVVHDIAGKALSSDPEPRMEDIAKAIWADFVVQQACGLPPWEDGGDHEFQMQFRSFARAALAAMAPPHTNGSKK